MIGPHVPSGDGVGTYHGVSADDDAGEHGRVIGDTGVVLEDGGGQRHIALIDNRVGVRVDVGEVRDGDAVSEHDPAPVIE